MYTIVFASLALVWMLLSALAFYLLMVEQKKSAKVRRLYDALRRKDPLEMDLELATVKQLLDELRRRPSQQFVLLMPRFEPTGLDLNMEIHNLAPDVALGLLKTAYRLSARHMQQRPDAVPEEDE